MRRSCGRFGLTACVPLAPTVLFAARARRVARLDAILRAYGPLYRRRDLLAAHLYWALSARGEVERKIAGGEVGLAEQDDGTLRLRVRLRKKSTTSWQPVENRKEVA